MSFATLDLNAGAQALDLKLDGIPELGDAERRAALTTWRGRMMNEFVSARVFEALAGQIERAGLPADMIDTAHRFAADERRHGHLCAAVVRALGGSAVAPIRPLAPVPEHADCAPMEALLRNVLSISCLAETVAVALVGAEREEAGPDCLRDVLTSILADEVRHARFGWTLLARVGPSLDDATRLRLGRYLELAFAHLEEHELRFLPAGPAPSDKAERVGVCDGDVSRELFYETVRTVIIPGLQARGLPAADAWARRSFADAA